MKVWKDKLTKQEFKKSLLGSSIKEDQILADIRAEIEEIERIDDECESHDEEYEDDEEQDAILNAIEREIEDQEVVDNYY